MTKKMKLISAVASLGVAATLVAAPLVAGSCQRTTRFDQEDDNRVYINSPWSATNDQGIALKAVVERYNADQKNTEGYVPVEVNFIGKGYNDSEYTQKLQAKDGKSFYNIMINYPSTASTILSYDMQLSLDPIKEDAEKVFGKSFLGFNNTIAGNIDKKQLLALPFTRSGEMSSIDKVVLGKFIVELQKYGATVKADKNVASFVEAYNANSSEKAGVDGIWASGALKDTDTEAINNLKAQAKNFTISDETFTSYVDLITFAKLAKSMYPYNDFAIIGMDSFPNSVYLMAAAINKGVENSIVSEDKNNAEDGGYNFSAITTKDTTQYKTIKQIYSLLKEAIQSQALWIGGSGSYGSNSLVRHQMAISIGSTAGYSHTFIRGGVLGFKFKKDKNVSSEFIPYAKQVTKPNTDKYPNALLTLTDDQLHMNTLFESFDKISTSKPQYQFFIADNKDGDNNVATTKDNIAKIVSLDEFKEGKGLISSSRSLSKDDSGKVYWSENGKKTAIDGAFYVGRIASVRGGGKTAKDSSAYGFYYIPASYTDMFKQTSSETLQKNEAAWLQSPSKLNSSDTMNYYTIQGPSIIGIHANDKEDKATLKFLKWLMTANLDSIKIEGTKHPHNFENVSPMQAIATVGSYIAPTKDFLSNEQSKKGLNEASVLTFNALKAIVENPSENAPVEDVAAPKSSLLRGAIEAAGKAAKNLSEQNHSELTFDDFIQRIKDQVK